MEKYKNKYRIKSARHPHWDYGSNGLYFITICTQNREHFFGEIVKTHNPASPLKMQLSEIGKIANDCWLQIPNHFPFVVLHNHIVMPNHIHGIIEIAKNENDDQCNDDVRDDGIGNVGAMGDGTVDVETQNFASLPPSKPPSEPPSEPSTEPSTEPSSSEPSSSEPSNDTKNKFGPQSKNLASIVRGFKIGVTKNAKQYNPNFKWQPRYHDHIIRNDKSFHTISNYIDNNPLNWNKDKFYE